MATLRVRTLPEYLEIVNRRKWVLIIPVLIIFCATFIVVRRLPSLYESRALIVVEPSQISPAYVKAAADYDLGRRLGSITQKVTSRTRLESVIQKFDLYRKERNQGMPMEMVLDLMRKNIAVKIDRDAGKVANAFSISFRGSDQRITQAVTNEIATQFIDENIKAVTQRAGDTTQLLAQELEKTRAELESIEKQRVEYMRRYGGEIPDREGALVTQLSSLRSHQQAIMNMLSTLRDKQLLYEQQINQSQEFLKKGYATNAGSPVHAMLLSKRLELESKLREYESRKYTDKHPDVVTTRSELELINKQIADLESKDADTPGLAAQRLSLNAVKMEIARREKEYAQVNAQIGAIESRLSALPLRGADLAKLNRDYEQTRQRYDSLLQKKQDATLSQQVITDQQGENFRLYDPANWPEVPVSPNKLMLNLLGAVMGLGFGLLLAASLELRRAFSLQNDRDVEHYTRLPLLASIPMIRTAQEERRALALRRLGWVGALALAPILVPLLAAFLEFTRLFETLANRGN